MKPTGIDWKAYDGLTGPVSGSVTPDTNPGVRGAKLPVDLDRGGNPGREPERGPRQGKPAKTPGPKDKTGVKRRRRRLTDREKARNRAKRSRNRLKEGLPLPKLRGTRGKGRQKLKPWFQRNKELKLCADKRPVGGFLVAVSTISTEARISGCTCKHRGCQDCDESRASRLVERFAPYLDGGAVLFTLTFGQRRWKDQIEAMDGARAIWRRFLDAVRRAYPWLSKKAWLMGYHRHTSGRPHIHWVIAMRWMSVAIVRRYWQAAGGGNVDVAERPQGGDEKSRQRAAWYVAAYVARAAAWGETALRYIRETRMKLVTTSRQVLPLERLDTAPWTMHFAGVKQVSAAAVGLVRARWIVDSGSPWTGPPRGGPLDLEAYDQGVDALELAGVF